MDPIDSLHKQGIHPHPGPPQILYNSSDSIFHNAQLHNVIESGDSDFPVVNVEVQDVTCAKQNTL